MVALNATTRTDAPLRTLALEGPARQRGVSHGRTLKDEIRAHIAVWHQAIREARGTEPERFIAMLLSGTDFLSAMKRWTPDLIEEMEGIAEGSGQEFDTIYALNLLDEAWAIFGKGAVRGQHCSGIGYAAETGQPTIIGQNMDIESFRDGFQVVQRIAYPDSDLKVMVLSYAGGIGLNGVSNRGLGVCVNTLLQLAPSRDGLPVACVMRAVLECRDTAEAVAKLKDVRHAAGQNYLIGDRTVVRDLECSANMVAELPAASTQLHTNHPLANGDYTEEYRATSGDPESEMGRKLVNSTARYDSLQNRSGKGRDLAAVRTALAAKDSAEHPVCRAKAEPLRNFTFAATAMVLGEKPEFHVAPGPSDTTPYQRFIFN